VQLDANNSKGNIVAAQGFEEHHGAPRSLAQQMPEHTTAMIAVVCSGRVCGESIYL
jgi:hypothetical protein